MKPQEEEIKEVTLEMSLQTYQAQISKAKQTTAQEILKKFEDWLNDIDWVKPNGNPYEISFPYKKVTISDINSFQNKIKLMEVL